MLRYAVALKSNMRCAVRLVWTSMPKLLLKVEGKMVKVLLKVIFSKLKAIFKNIKDFLKIL